MVHISVQRVASRAHRRFVSRRLYHANASVHRIYTWCFGSVAQGGVGLGIASLPRPLQPQRADRATRTAPMSRIPAVRRVFSDAGRRFQLDLPEVQLVPGELTYLIGPNGSGKTLYLRTIGSDRIEGA